MGIEAVGKRSLTSMRPVLLAEIAEVFRYRELVWNLVLRDLKVRYKNSVLGFLWSLLNPLLMMVVFTIAFTFLQPASGIDRLPIYILCAVLPWNFFSSAVIGSTGSVVANIHLVKKVYFPREILPLSAVLSHLAHFFLALGVLFGMLLVFRFKLTIWILLLPVIVLEQFAFTLGLGLILATSNIFYRDTEHIVQLMLLAWLFLTPVFYPMEILPRHYSLWGLDLNIWRLAYIINPMASIISSYRVILYYGGPPALDFLLRTLLTTLAVLVVGYLIFARYSKLFAEIG